VEGQTGTVTLPEEDPNTFNLYVCYLYSGRLLCKHETFADDYEVLSNLYALGERLMDDYLKDRVITALVATAAAGRAKEARPSAQDINTIYEATTHESPARKMLVDMFVYYDQSFPPARDVLNMADHDFVVDVCETLAGWASIPNAMLKRFDERMSGTACAYHHHRQGECCPAEL